MNQRSKSARVIAVIAAAAVLLAVGFTAGRVLTGGGSDGAQMPYTGAPTMSPESSGADSGVAGSMGGAPSDTAVEEYGTRSLADPSVAQDKGSGDRLVVKNAGIALRVDDVEAAVGDVRTLATGLDAEVTDLFLDTGSDDGARPLGEGPSGPSSAQITVRVPVDNLDKLTGQLDSLGDVLSESSSASDVTEQHVDLEARLKNLRAEELRLRQFFERANNVEDLLAVQGELSRVRGEIEAMTAQITYLERQAARATLTISLTEPGPIVSPTGQDWGFRQAITDGLRGAVALVTTAITALIAIAPLLALLALGWLILAKVRRARQRQDGDFQDSSTAIAGEESEDDK